MIEVKAIIQPFQLNDVIEALQEIKELPGVTVSDVRGFGRARAKNAKDKVIDGSIEYARKVKLEIVIPESSWTGFYMRSSRMLIQAIPAMARSSSARSSMSCAYEAGSGGTEPFDDDAYRRGFAPATNTPLPDDSGSERPDSPPVAKDANEVEACPWLYRALVLLVQNWESSRSPSERTLDV